MHHPEDAFIDDMALGKLLVRGQPGGKHVSAGSLEGIIAQIIQVIMMLLHAGRATNLHPLVAALPCWGRIWDLASATWW